MNKQLALIKFYAYEKYYPRRHELTPIHEIPWGDWFKEKFGEDIEKYHARVIKKRAKNGTDNKQQGLTF
jgi:hypothetical protein